MKKYLPLLLLFISLAFLLCCKGNKVKENVGRMRVINASYLSGGINIDMDYGTVYNTYVEYLNYSLFRDYIATKHKLQIRNITGAIFIDTAITIVENKDYTLFVYDSAGYILHKVIEENFITPIGSTCNVRFLHLSNNVNRVDVLDTANTLFFHSMKNGEYSPYTSFNSGTYKFIVNQAGTSNLIYASPPTTFQPGYFYTMYLKGNTGSVVIDSVGLFEVGLNGDY